VINLWKRTWTLIYEKLLFFAPVLAVIGIATLLVYSTFLADISLTAVVVAEEGTSTEAASAGLVNALTFILPAIIGGFAIALLFKYRKKLTLKYFFGGALFFAGLFISFFFGDSILFLAHSRFYNLHIFNFDPMNLKLFDFSILFTFSGIYLIMIIFCGVLSFSITYVISSRKFKIKTKNYALIFQSALMGAFLSVILPTYTVIILLIGLSLYDIYSVRRGPIKDIVKYTLEDESNNIQMANYPGTNKTRTPIKSDKSHHLGCIVSSKISNDNTSNLNQDNAQAKTKPNPETNIQSDTSTVPSTIKPPISTIHATQPGLPPESQTTNFQNEKVEPTVNPHQDTKFYPKIEIEKLDDYDEEDSILTSMTYSSRDWDIGIGDLVFYSLLASQPLTPYFIFKHGIHLLDTYGFWIFWLISFFTIIGILIGFVITIRLLERNSMLPGLPLSIALGLTGFLGSTFIIMLI
jgi:hypothetical protein